MATILHPLLGNVRYETHVVSDDPQEQVEQVIGLMRGYAVEDARSPAVERDLQAALGAWIGSSGSSGSSDGGHLSGQEKAAAIFSHVKGRLQFVQDEKTAAQIQGLTEIPIAEALIRPADMAGMCNRGECTRVGDCDDYAMYAASLLLAAGIPCAFVTVAADGQDPSRFSHVYVAAYPPEGRMPLDVSHGEYPGWETDGYYARREWPLSGGISCNLVPLALAAVAAWWLWNGRKTVWA